MFRKLDLFPSPDEGETPDVLDPLGRANLNHWSSLDLFPSPGERDTPTLFDPSERANFDR
jgi:hypothetical protein